MDLSSIFAGLKLVTAPTAEPITLATAIGYLRTVTDSGGIIDQDVLAFITLARQRCEAVLRRALLRQTWQLSLKNWPGRDYHNWPQNSAATDLSTYRKFDHIPLPGAAPLISVTSVTYTDTEGVVRTMPSGNIAGGYNVDLNFEPGRIVLPFSQIWPTPILLPGAPIQIIYQCGYADAADLAAKFEGHAAVLHAMKRIISYAFTYKIPPTQFDKMDAGEEYMLNQILTPFRVF